MGKVSIGLRGWRFDEDDLFTADGDWRPLEAIPEGPRQRLVRLKVLVGKPCDACYLEYGDEQRCREATIVYGEPLDEVVVCDRHEADFLFWFRERGGHSIAGDPTFRDAFHEWFDDGGRAPDDYEGLDHVETAPEALPDLPDPEEVFDREQDLLEEREDTPAEAAAGGSSDADGNDTEADDADESDEDPLEDLDLSREYPTG